MENISKSHVVMLCFVLCLLIITPFLSSNTRPTFLYFITNLLIIALGVESGLLSSNKGNSQDETLPPSFTHNDLDVPYNHSIDQNETKSLEFLKSSRCNQEPWDDPFDSRVIEKSVLTHIKETTNQRLSRVETHTRRNIIGGYNYKLPQKSSSMPSLFFRGIEGNNGDTHFNKEAMAHLYDDDSVEEEGDEVIDGDGEISGQELYVKAEAFIGNFYKQLKLQRQNSLKRIYGIYSNT